MNVKTIYIHRNDDLASVVEKIILAKSENIILVILEGSEIAKHRINFQILKRESEHAKKRIFVETDSDFIKNVCQEEGIELAQDYKNLLGVSLDTKPKHQVADIVIPYQEKEETIKEQENLNQKEKITDNLYSEDNSIKIQESVGEEKIPIRNIESIEEKKDFREKITAEKASNIENDHDFWDMLEKGNLKNRKILKEGEKKKEEYELDNRERNKIKSNFSEEITDKKKSQFWHSLIIGGIVVSLLVGFYFSFFVLPRASVEVSLKKAKKEAELTLTVSGDADRLDFENYIIPGKILTFERMASKTFPATDYKNVESKAFGTIRVYNAYSSLPQVLIATTRFRANKSGKIFRTPKRVIIPGAKIKSGKIEPSYVDIVVYADKAGEDYNIGPDKFSIPGFKGTDKYYGFYGQSFKSMKGGKVGKAKVVSVSDIKKAEQAIGSELELLLKKEFNEKIPPEYKKIDNNFILEKKILKTDAQENSVQDSFTVKADFILKGIIFKNKDLRELAENVFKKLDEAKEWDIKSIDYKFSNQTFDILKNKLLTNLKIEYNLVKKIDKESLKKEILGKKSDEVKKILLLKKEINSAKVVFWPFWVNRVPKDARKLELSFK